VILQLAPLVNRKISFLKGGDDFTPDRMNAFFRASESVKPAERL
jgi:hypothetical protein